MSVWQQLLMQIFYKGSDPSKSPICTGGLQPLSNTMLLGATRVSLSNGISFAQRLYKCDDRWTDHATVPSVAILGIADGFKLEKNETLVF